MRYIYQSEVQDGTGNFVAGATVTVTRAGGTTKASIYSALTGGTVDSDGIITTGTDGTFAFYVDEDDYSHSQQFRIVWSKSGFTSETWDYIQIFPDGERTLLTSSTVDQGDAAIVGTLAWHVADASTDPVIVKVLPGTYLVSTSITTASTMTLDVPQKVAFTDDASNADFTIGKLKAGPYQIFDWGTGTGAVTMGGGAVSEFLPEWWATNTTPGTTDMTTAIDSAIAAGGEAAVIKFTSDSYKIGALTQITVPITLDFNNAKIIPGTAGIMIDINIVSFSYSGTMTIKDGRVYGGTIANGIKVTNCYGALIDNFHFNGSTTTHSFIWNLVGYNLKIANLHFWGCAGVACIYLSYSADGTTDWTTASSIENIDISTFDATNETGIGIIMEGGLPIAIKDSTFQYIHGGAIQYIGLQKLEAEFSNNYFENNIAFDVDLASGISEAGTSGIVVFTNNYFGPVSTPASMPTRVLMDDSSMVTAIGNFFYADVGGFGGEAPRSFIGIGNSYQGAAVGYTGTFDRELSDSVRGLTKKTIINNIVGLAILTLTTGTSDYIIEDVPLGGTGTYDIWEITGSYNFSAAINQIYRVYVNVVGAGAISGSVIIDKEEWETLTLDVAPSGGLGAWFIGDVVSGGASGATAEIMSVISTTVYKIRRRSLAFTLGEVLSVSTATADQGAAHPTTATVSGVSQSYVEVEDNSDATYSIKISNLGGATMYYQMEYLGNRRLS